MAALYTISTCRLDLPTGASYLCHAGRGVGLNNPNAIKLVAIGPLPPGGYTCGPWQDGSAYGANFARLGPFVTRLTPDADNRMYGRNDFCCHGGNGSNPPTDSEGCIVTGPAAREAWAAYQAATGDLRLEVVADA